MKKISWKKMISSHQLTAGVHTEDSIYYIGSYTDLDLNWLIKALDKNIIPHVPSIEVWLPLSFLKN